MVTMRLPECEVPAVSWSFNPFAGHDFDKYMKRYVPFDQGYGLQ